MKVKGQILICTAIMLNDHSNPYIESTTVLSDIYIIYLICCHYKTYITYADLWQHHMHILCMNRATILYIYLLYEAT